MTTLCLSDAPVIAGLCFRPVRGEEDGEALYAVHAGRMAHDQVDPLSTYEDWPSREGLQRSLSNAVEKGRSG